METTLAQNNNYKPRVLEEHNVPSDYEQKKQRTVVFILCAIVIAALVAWYFIAKNKELTPEETLQSLSQSSAPITKNEAQVFAQGEALGALSSPPSTTSEERLQMLNNWNN